MTFTLVRCWLAGADSCSQLSHELTPKDAWLHLCARFTDQMHRIYPINCIMQYTIRGFIFFLHQPEHYQRLIQCAVRLIVQTSIENDVNKDYSISLSLPGFSFFLLWPLFFWLPVDDAATAESDELMVDRSYVKKKLEHGLTRIWQVWK